MLSPSFGSTQLLFAVVNEPPAMIPSVIKSCKNITSKQALLIIPITKYFSNRNMLNKIITILKGESISLRLIDWFVTNFCKKNNVLYNLNDFKEAIEKALSDTRSWNVSGQSQMQKRQNMNNRANLVIAATAIRDAAIESLGLPPIAPTPPAKAAKSEKSKKPKP